MSACLITGDVNFDHSINMVPTGLLHSTVTVFPFGINRLLEENSLKLYQYPVYPQTLLNNFSTCQCISPSPVTPVVF